MSRDRWAAIIATVVVIVVVSLGLLSLGAPGHQRSIQADLQKVREIQRLAQEINIAEGGATGPLPQTLAGFPAFVRQNATPGEAFTYRPKTGHHYELCAVFAFPSQPSPSADAWAHPKGHFCFELDASQTVQPPPFAEF